MFLLRYFYIFYESTANDNVRPLFNNYLLDIYYVSREVWTQGQNNEQSTKDSVPVYITF